MTNGYEIDEDTFKGMSLQEQNWILYKTYNKDRLKTECLRKDCQQKFKSLENRKLTDKGFAGAMGIIGGFIAGIVK